MKIGARRDDVKMVGERSAVVKKGWNAERFVPRPPPPDMEVLCSSANELWNYRKDPERVFGRSCGNSAVLK